MKNQNDPKLRTIITTLTCIVFCMVLLPPNAIAQQPVEVTDEKTPRQEPKVQLFSLSIDDAEIKDVLEALAYQADLSLVLPEEVTGKVSLRLRDVTWRTAFNAVLQAGGYSATQADGVLFITIQEEEDEEPVIIEEPLSLEGFNLNFANAKKVKETVTKLLSEKGKMGINERLNSIVVTDTPQNLGLIRQAVQRLDVKAPQVMIEALIVNVKLTDEFKMGVDWTTLGTSQNSLTHDLSPVSDYSLGQLSFFKTTGDWIIDGAVKFIEAHDNVKILASPRILVLNNHTATIDAVEEIPYREQTQTSAGGNLSSTSFKQAGIKLQVTPQITDDGYIIMQVKPEQSAQTGTFDLGSEGDIPVIETRKTETTLRIKNGQTIIIGGLRKKRPTSKEVKVPILGDVPLIGMLFRRVETDHVESELGVFITPHIYTDGKLSADELNLLGSTNTKETLIDLLDLLRL